MTIPEEYDIVSILKEEGYEVEKSSSSGIRLEKEFCLKIQKSIFGTPQSGRNWNIDGAKLLKSKGFTPLDKEPCLHIKVYNSKEINLVGLFIDDVVYACKEGTYEIIKEAVEGGIGNERIR